MFYHNTVELLNVTSVLFFIMKFVMLLFINGGREFVFPLIVVKSRVQLAPCND